MARITDCSSCKKDVAVCMCPRSRTRMVTHLRQPKGHCHECQLSRGAKLPRGDNAITCSLGNCGKCKKQTYLVPDCDYNWPKLGKKAIWD